MCFQSNNRFRKSILTSVFARWFSFANPREHYLPAWEYSGHIEMIVWSIPTLVIAIIGGITR